VRVPQASGSLYKLPTGLDVEEGLLLGDIASTAAFGVAQAGLAGWEGAEEGNAVLAMKHLLERTVSKHEDGSVSFRTLTELGACIARPSPVCAVVGCGPVGLLAVAMARLCLILRGFTNPCVLAIDGVSERVEAAAKWGATPLLLRTGASTEGLSPEEIMEHVKQCSAKSGRSGRGADVVVECVGHPSALKLSYDILAPFGTISSLGVHTSPFPFSPGDVYDKNATFRSGRCPARSMMESAEILLKVAKLGREGVFEPILMTDIVTHRFPITEGRHAYDIFDQKRDRCLKALLYPDINWAPQK
jgi:threonine dehydrogenase-like Zn-dependent dehydrogenase